MSKQFVLALLLYGISASGSANNTNDARQTLKKWGMAYCVGELAYTPALKIEASETMGAYFQLGDHASESAYIHVRSYVDKELRSRIIVSKESGKPMPIVRCLDIFDSAKYIAMIRQQDRYISR